MNINSFTNTEFYKNVFTLSFGTLIAQSIPFLFYPVISRIYKPEDFAVFALYFSIIGLFDVISTGRYELAIIGQKDDKDSINLIIGMVIISFFLSIFLFFIFYFFNKQICDLLENNNLSSWLYIIPFSIFFLSIYKSLNYWLIKQKAFKKSSINKITQKVTESSSVVYLGLNNYNNGLIIGDFLGRIIIVFVSLHNSIKKGFNLRLISISRIKSNIRNNINYPKYNLFPSLFNSFSTLLPIFIISSYYNETITGYFNFTRQILVIPLILISTSISQVLFKQISEKKNNNELILNEIMGIAKKLSIIAIIFILTLILFGKFLFEIIFGVQWIESGIYSQILVFSFAIQFIVSPLSIVFPALNQIKILSIWQLCYFLLISSLFFFKSFSIYQFLTAYLIIDIISYCVYFIIIYLCVRNYDLKQS